MRRRGDEGKEEGDTGWWDGGRTGSMQAGGVYRPQRGDSGGRVKAGLLQICKLKGRALLNSTHTAEEVQTASEGVWTCDVCSQLLGPASAKAQLFRPEPPKCSRPQQAFPLSASLPVFSRPSRFQQDRPRPEDEEQRQAQG